MPHRFVSHPITSNQFFQYFQILAVISLFLCKITYRPCQFIPDMAFFLVCFFNFPNQLKMIPAAAKQYLRNPFGA